VKNSKRAEAKRGRMETVYQYLLSIADPMTGRVATTGEMVGDVVGITGAAGRVYLQALCREGKIVRISDVRQGQQTLYRIPALCKGDVLTYYEETHQEEPGKVVLDYEEKDAETTIEIQNKSPKIEDLPISLPGVLDEYYIRLFKDNVNGEELTDRLTDIAGALRRDKAYKVSLMIEELKDA
jgi:hypothetical protein